ncbi:MAG: hypothetical protein HRT43_03535 [Campylobacteraceae bacterium]|nr:hypothetical protein [Campylobacteraceae bacterium]
MYKRTRISEIKKHMEEIDSYNLTLIDDYLIKLDQTPFRSKVTVLGEIVTFLNSINVKHEIDKNLNIIIER